MSKYISIQIPISCHEDWDNMTSATQGRHCNSCQKTVIDFTSMTDTQLANFFKTKNENVCGRFYSDQLNNEITISKSTLPWLKYFFTITLPAFLFSQKSNGQSKMIAEQITHTNKSKNVNLQEQNEKDSFKFLEEVIVKSSINKSTHCTIAGSVSILMGGALSSMRVHTSKVVKAKSLNEITIYPNPINANTKMNIAWKNNIISSQYIEIFDATGKLLQKEIINISTKLQNAFFTLKQIPAGFYIIRITDTKTLQKTSKEFIVN